MPDKKNFKEGLKATSIFGGVQVFNILIGIIRSKLVAIILGPEGIGLNGILQSTIQLVNGVSGFGLGTSAVKDVSESYASGDEKKLSRTISVFRKLVWLTGLFGFIACFVLSPLLSKVSFDSYDYILAFAAVSVTVLFMQLTDGQRVLLQGTHRYKYMAKASVIGSVIGLFTTIPLYYVFGMNGVVPAIILASITSLCLMWYFAKRVTYDNQHVPLRRALHEGRGMMKMGFFLSLQGLLSLLMVYVLRIFINRYGGLADVGLFVAGFAIVDTYVGMVFSAMSTEYYPRLASHNNGSVEEYNETINQQIELSLMLVSPLICAFLIFGNFAVSLLYSDKFLPVTMMLCLAIMGNYFKAPSWCIAYSFLAKGDAFGFFYNEVSASILSTALKILFYYYWGLTGIGVAYLLGFFLYLLQVIIACHYRYEYKFDYRMLKTYLFQMLLGVTCFLLFAGVDPILRYGIGLLPILLSVYLSYKVLNNYVSVKQMLANIVRR